MRRSLCTILFSLCSLSLPSLLWAQSANLERPVNGGIESGLGDVHGWKCTGTNLTYTIDNSAHIQLAYGLPRNDTVGSCGDANNGFIMQQNWNFLTPGQHTIRVFDDGAQFAEATFTVTTFGTEFLDGASGSCVLPNFPQFGTNAVVQWQESSQNFSVAQVQTGIPPGAYTAVGSETYSSCADPDLNGAAEYIGYLIDNSSGTTLSASTVFLYSDGSEVQAILTGTKSLFGDNVQGGFTANTFDGGVFVGNSAGLFQGTISAAQVFLSYNGIAPITKCLIVGSLQGVR